MWHLRPGYASNKLTNRLVNRSAIHKSTWWCWWKVCFYKEGETQSSIQSSSFCTLVGSLPSKAFMVLHSLWRGMKEESLTEPPYWLTSTHLAYHCMKWAWMSNCHFPEVTNAAPAIACLQSYTYCNARNSDVGQELTNPSTVWFGKRGKWLHKRAEWTWTQEVLLENSIQNKEKLFFPQYLTVLPDAAGSLLQITSSSRPHS